LRGGKHNLAADTDDAAEQDREGSRRSAD
jgi:hypothetical protein